MEWTNVWCAFLSVYLFVVTMVMAKPVPSEDNQKDFSPACWQISKTGLKLCSHAVPNGDDIVPQSLQGTQVQDPDLLTESTPLNASGRRITPEMLFRLIKNRSAVNGPRDRLLLPAPVSIQGSGLYQVTAQEQQQTNEDEPSKRAFDSISYGSPFANLRKRTFDSISYGMGLGKFSKRTFDSIAYGNGLGGF